MSLKTPRMYPGLEEKWLESCRDCRAYLGPETPKMGLHCQRCVNFLERMEEIQK